MNQAEMFDLFLIGVLLLAVVANVILFAVLIRRDVRRQTRRVAEVKRQADATEKWAKRLAPRIDAHDLGLTWEDEG